MEKPENSLPVRNGKIMPVHRVPQKLLLELLRHADAIAAQRVREAEPPPGPFGAATYCYDTASGELHAIGGVDSNSVNADGPGAHAEANNMSRAQQALVADFLKKHRGNKNLVLLFISTAESCPACYAKQQVFAAWLQSRGLIEKERILTVFGADFAATLEVAGFSDAVLLNELRAHPDGGGSAAFSDIDLFSCASEVRSVLKGSAPVAVIHRNGEVFAVGHDERAARGDVLASAEMNAIRAAFEKRKAQGVSAPWNLRGYTLATPTDVRRAPLARTGAYWASIADIEHVKGAEPEPTQEAAMFTNENLFRAVVKPYNSVESLTYVLHVAEDGEGRVFENLAQKAWRERVATEAAKGRDIHYDARKKDDHE